jgi:hypothetical protein
MLRGQLTRESRRQGRQCRSPADSRRKKNPSPFAEACAGDLALIETQSWQRHLKPRIEAARERLHDVLAIPLANKLARIAFAVLNKERNFEVTRTITPWTLDAGRSPGR